MIVFSLDMMVDKMKRPDNFSGRFITQSNYGYAYI